MWGWVAGYTMLIFLLLIFLSACSTKDYGFNPVHVGAYSN